MYIFIIIWASWLVSEILLSKLLRSKQPTSKELDSNSLLLMWITIGISISIGVIVMIFVPVHISKSHLVGYFGLFLIVCGAIVRFAAIKALGNLFTVNLAIHEDQHIVKTGLYRFVRHPSYTGSLLSFVGLGVSFNNLISLLVIFIPIFFSFIYRIKVEERLMLQKFGSEYSDYQKTTKRLIPFIY